MTVLALVRAPAARKVVRPAAVLTGVVATATCIYLLAPLAVVVATSLTKTKYLAFPPHGVTLHWYAHILSYPAFLNGFFTSVELASAASLLALAAGLPAAWALHHSASRAARVLEAAYLAPIIVPAVVLGLGYLVVLQKMNILGTFMGALLAHVVLVTPFVLRSATSGLRGLDPSLEEAASSLGAAGLRRFWWVVLPDLRKSLAGGCVMAFVISFDEAVVTLFIVGPHFSTLPVTIFTYLQYSDDPTVAAVSTFLILISVGIMSLLARFVSLRAARLGPG